MSALACSYAGQSIELCEFDGKRALLVSVRALAPGQPITLEVPLETGCTLELKSLGSVKRTDGRYEVRARTVTLPRGVRTRLLAHFAPAG